jgi:hypothetical protein
MKKYLPYIIGVVVVACVIFLLSKAIGPQRRINQRITLLQKDKIPYGTAVAKKLLPEIFPETPVYYDTKSPGNWDSINTTSYNQAVILVSIDFDADRDELATLLNFARQGNFVYIIARSFSPEAHQFFNFSYNEHTADEFLNLY